MQTHPYARPGSRLLCLDLLLPHAPGPHPLILILHGGGWRQGSRADLGNEWLLDHGFALARLDYRLSPEAPFPAPLDDCRNALTWLRTRASTLNLDPARFAILGTSAGGLLALLLAGEPAAALRAVITYGAPTDLLLRARTQPHLTEAPGGSVHDFLGGPVASRLPLARLASPAQLVTSSAAPALLLHGTLDKTVLPDQPLAYLTAAFATNARATVLTVPDTPHWGDAFRSSENCTRLSTFLLQHLA